MSAYDRGISAYSNLLQDASSRSALSLPSIPIRVGSGEHGPIAGFQLGPEDRLRPPVSLPSGSLSPADSHALPRDYYFESQSGLSGSQFESPPISSMQNPKRAYRQRRKDPSCDACRDRKVKCDATDTTSCTECSSRNVRCQFTKDTNRRMSSIKQVQDLERQLYDTRTQLERLRSSGLRTEHNSYSHISYPVSDTVDLSRSPRRMLKARSQHDFSNTRAHLSDVGRGILKPLIAPLNNDTQDRCEVPCSALPLGETSEKCLESYFECVHRRFPVLHWPSFCRTLWDLYSREVMTNVKRETVALTFAVLGLGALFSSEKEVRTRSEGLMRRAIDYTDMWTDQIGVDQSLVCLLVSMYMAETNAKSVSWAWLGSAIRMGQDKGLHIQGGTWSHVEGEIRKRIWYSLYVSDRAMATELGRPMLIVDEDCDTEYPGLLQEEEDISELFHPQKPTILLASAHVARLLSQLTRICRSLCISTDTVQKFENSLANCMQLFPRPLQIGANGPLDPLCLAPTIQFQNARLMLYRHNISPATSSEQRSIAINQCCVTACDTAALVSRCFINTTDMDRTEEAFRRSALSATCTHLWRCMLFLAFRRQWDAFRVLLRCSSVIGDRRPVNISCSRHLDLFLHSLLQHYNTKGQWTLEADEDLIVLLSGDLQSGTSGWVWGNYETGTLLSQGQKHGRISHQTHSTGGTPSHSVSFDWNSPLSTEEVQQQGGWAGIDEMARRLEGVPEGPLRTTESQYSSRQSPTGSQMEVDQTTLDTRSRMAIASITDS